MNVFTLFPQYVHNPLLEAINEFVPLLSKGIWLAEND